MSLKILVSIFLVNNADFSQISIEFSIYRYFCTGQCFLGGLLGYERKSHRCSHAKTNTSRESKKREIESYFDGLGKLTHTSANNLMTVEALDGFTLSFDELSSQVSNFEMEQELRAFYREHVLKKYQQNTGLILGIDALVPSYSIARKLQYAYVLNHSEILNEVSSYDELHQKYHPVFDDYLQNHGLYDIFLIDPKGRIVYSVFKEIDFATNLLNGPYSQSGLGQLVKKVIAIPSKESMIIDFSPYLPSYGKPAAFIATSVFDKNVFKGVFAMQVSIDRVNDIMTNNKNWEKEGFGKSGETYIVGPGFGMRNDSRFLIEEPELYLQMLNTIGTDKSIINKISRFNSSIYYQKVESDAAHLALQGIVDNKVVNDYRGVSVFSAFTPLSIKSLNWALLSEIDEDEVYEPLQETRKQLLSVFYLIFVILVATASILAYRITNPLSKIIKTLHQIAFGKYWKAVPVEGHDEVAQLAQSVNEMAESITTAEKKVKLALKDSEKANEAKSLFLKTLSHELKTPLNAIIGFGELLQSNVEADEETIESLNEITSAGHHLLSMINAAIRFVAIEENHNDILVKLSPYVIVERFLQKNHNLIKEKSIKAKNAIDPSLELEVHEADLQEVLSILIKNAVMYTRPSSQINLSADRDENYLLISIADEGEGIAKENIDKIFEPFSRLDKSSSDMAGIGLGLSIAKRIVQKRGWRLGVTSKFGVGSNFTIDISC